MKEIIDIQSGNLDHQIIEGIKNEIELYEGWIRLASMEKKAITGEDFNNLTIITEDAQKHKAQITEMESRFFPLREKWKEWKGRNTEAVMRWVERLSRLIRELASLQDENQKLIENLLEETQIHINNLKTDSRAFARYSSQTKCLPRFVDIKR